MTMEEFENNNDYIILISKNLNVKRKYHEAKIATLSLGYLKSFYQRDKQSMEQHMHIH